MDDRDSGNDERQQAHVHYPLVLAEGRGDDWRRRGIRVRVRNHDARFALRRTPGGDGRHLRGATARRATAIHGNGVCKGETTASGVGVRTGIAAADSMLLPVGTVVRIDTTNELYDGIWTIMDTGPAVQGRTIDLYLWSCHDALRFGRQTVQLTVLRLGWNPQNSEPGRVDSLFRQREIDRAQMPLPAKPVDPEGLG